MKKLLPLLVILVIVGYYFYKSPTQTPQPTNSQPSPSTAISNKVLGMRTKTDNCVIINSVQDKDCTPGAIFPTVTKEQVCVSGYSSSVRNVPTATKNKVFAEYGITSHQPGEYEVDHLISLELGGSNDISNLWPEAAEPRPGFHEKDKVENYLHQQVCNGSMTLSEAQREISSDWYSVYQKIASLNL